MVGGARAVSIVIVMVWLGVIVSVAIVVMVSVVVSSEPVIGDERLSSPPLLRLSSTPVGEATLAVMVDEEDLLASSLPLSG